MAELDSCDRDYKATELKLFTILLLKGNVCCPLQVGRESVLEVESVV